MIKRGMSKALKRKRNMMMMTLELIQAVQDDVDAAMDLRTARGLSRRFDIPQRTMNQFIKDNVGVNVYRRMGRQGLKPIDQTKRKKPCKTFLSKHKKKLKDGIILFQDEIPFSISEILSNKNKLYVSGASSGGADHTIHYEKKGSTQNYRFSLLLCWMGSALSSSSRRGRG